MPYIQFPDVPIADGVPELRRPINFVSGKLADNPAIAVAVSSISNLLASAIDSKVRWGLFDVSGNQLGLPPSDTIFGTDNFVDRLASAALLNGTASLSVLDTGFIGESTIGTMPIEGGKLANFNKVNRPDVINVRLVFTGNDADRAYFIDAVRSAKASTDLYSYVSPEITLLNQNIIGVRIQRRDSQGLDMVIADLDLMEVRSVTAQYTVATTPINNPVNASATPATNTGSTQTSTPDTSTLKSLVDKVSNLKLGN